jgi:glycosyltransferase involved in cell wall biosynthesis
VNDARLSRILEPSKILILHSTYLSGWASGENSVVRDEERLLREAGHHVVAWTPGPGPTLSHARLGSRAIWSPDATRHVRALIKRHRPDIVHCHNLFPMLSPAVIRAATEDGAKVVVTLHNYRMSCLPATFTRDGEICELCLGRIPWRGVMFRCYRGSLPGSAALAASLSLHRAFRTFDQVSLFLPVSGFVRDKHVQAGFESDRLMTKPNFCWPGPRRHSPGAFFLYVGRLAPEKDVGTLLKAWRRVDERLIVAGDGPDRRRLEAIAPPNVEFVGTVSPAQVNALLQEARALVAPTRCNEGGPRSVIEAYAAGVPVIATALGALPELVDHGVTGLLVPEGNVDAWVESVRKLSEDDTSLRLGQAAFDRWARLHSPEQGLQALERAYRTAGAA